jgi:hypothetical protein
MKHLLTLSLLFGLTFCFSAWAQDNSEPQLNNDQVIKSTCDGEIDTECPAKKANLNRDESAKAKPNLEDRSKKPDKKNEVIEQLSN